MTEEKVLGLPKQISNSDDELMGISVNYDPDEKLWSISYADEGSSISAEDKTLDGVVRKIRAEAKRVYGTEIDGL